MSENNDRSYRTVAIMLLGAIASLLWIALDRLDLIIKLMKGAQS
jgi:hypothetical protein